MRGLMGMAPTGNGRRESFAHPGDAAHDQYLHARRRHDPQEMIASVKSGLYAVNFGGGQVDITSGKYVFSATEAYLIEDGKVTAPVKGATLIGNGPETMQKVAMIGPRHGAGRWRRRLRQGRAVGAGGRGPAFVADFGIDRRRNRGWLISRGLRRLRRRTHRPHRRWMRLRPSLQSAQFAEQFAAGARRLVAPFVRVAHQLAQFRRSASGVRPAARSSPRRRPRRAGRRAAPRCGASQRFPAARRRRPCSSRRGIASSGHRPAGASAWPGTPAALARAVGGDALGLADAAAIRRGSATWPAAPDSSATSCSPSSSIVQRRTPVGAAAGAEEFPVSSSRPRIAQDNPLNSPAIDIAPVADDSHARLQRLSGWPSALLEQAGAAGASRPKSAATRTAGLWSTCAWARWRLVKPPATAASR